ncbi:uncharacterized protein LOC116306514 isoform X2 [Actinia tenebrosa]|uniref:Uncharacterized protein LOC116306514 isoform X2 n=1 Tax=Actinia tenebrosa TaxID=6105 RepID=A0A6P8IZ43_ACTTE|nr:uncharacterized protein LOC116306514 isoform X2 [Actinia tenebrosa]
MAFLRFRSVYCISKNDIDINERTIFSSVCITTATLSAYGAFVQLRFWSRQLKDFDSRRKPSSNPVIVFCLALADLFTCIGVILMSILLMTVSPPYHNPKLDKNIPKEKWYKYIAVPIESFTMFAYISSYMWTLAYALDICLQVYNKDKSLRTRGYLICFWLAPVWLVVVGQYANLYKSIGFCSIKDQEILHYMVCFIPLVCVVILLPIIYILAVLKLRKNIMTAHGCYTNAERELLFAVKKKFLLIVSVFMICWITNVVDGFIDFSIVLQQKDQYVKENGTSQHFKLHFPIWIVEEYHF